jgi:hypothetical protein
MRGQTAPQAAALAGGAPGSPWGAGRAVVPGAAAKFSEFLHAARRARPTGGPGLMPGSHVQARG